jgi:hypothetical protein
MYSATVSTFLRDFRDGRLIDLMQEGAARMHLGCGPAEKKSWLANAQVLARIVERIAPATVIALEMLDPVVRQRCDAVILGIDKGGIANTVILELKQWDTVSIVEGSDRLVLANTHGRVMEEREHPSLQAHGYVKRLRYWVRACAPDEADAISVSAYAVLYNMSPDKLAVITAGQYAWTQNDAPAVGAADIETLATTLRQRVQNGRGESVFKRLSESEIRPSKPFVELAISVITRRDIFPLIPEQRAAYAEVMRSLTVRERKTVIIVEGGPGTGKTAVALQVLADTLAKGLQPKYVVKSAAMNRSISRSLGEDLRPLVSFTDRFGFLDANSCDLLLVDEAHRLDGIANIDWRSGSRRYKTTAELKSSLPIVREIIRAAKVSAFFLDEGQIIQPHEANRASNINQAAHAEGAQIIRVRLAMQHRLCGSMEFIQWTDKLLGSSTPPASPLPDCGRFLIDIVPRPQKLVEIHEDLERQTPNSSRLVTGWCWKWAQKPLPDGSLQNEVIVPGEIARPWEAPKQGKPGRLNKEIARGEYWATHSSGALSFGSVYTAQGFDIPNVCLLWPRDLMIRNGKWVGNPERSHTRAGDRGGPPKFDNVDPALATLDEDEIVPYLLNVYRILLTRATARMYISFLDEETKEFFVSMFRAQATAHVRGR